jgi:hypothetical protein
MRLLVMGRCESGRLVIGRFVCASMIHLAEIGMLLEY